MQITIEIPDDKAEQLLGGFVAASGAKAGSAGTLEAQAKAALIAHIKQSAKNGLVRQAMLKAAADIDPVTIT